MYLKGGTASTASSCIPSSPCSYTEINSGNYELFLGSVLDDNQGSKSRKVEKSDKAAKSKSKSSNWVPVPVPSELALSLIVESIFTSRNQDAQKTDRKEPTDSQHIQESESSQDHSKIHVEAKLMSEIEKRADSNALSVFNLAFRQTTDPQKLPQIWRSSVELPVSALQVMQRILRERSHWQPGLISEQLVQIVDSHSDIVRFTVRDSSSLNPVDLESTTREYLILRYDFHKYICSNSMLIFWATFMRIYI